MSPVSKRAEAESRNIMSKREQSPNMANAEVFGQFLYLKSLNKKFTSLFSFFLLVCVYTTSSFIKPQTCKQALSIMLMPN